MNHTARVRGGLVLVAAVAALLVTPATAPGHAGTLAPSATSQRSTASGSTSQRSVAAAERPRWKVRLDEITAGKDVGVSLRLDSAFLYNHAGKRLRVPASNQKLLLSMAVLERFDPVRRFPTRAAASVVSGGVVRGDLWLIGRGDPTVTGRTGRSTPYGPARLSALARRIKDAGIRRITGSVIGSRGYFARDWWATGWRSYYPERYAPLATALAFQHNTADGRHIRNPEYRAARSLTRTLRRIGVAVDGSAGAGRPRQTVHTVAEITSPTVQRLITLTNRRSSNFFAEMLGKRLSVASVTRPGSIRGGAAAIEHYAAERGVDVEAHDSSGLSYANGVSTRGLTTLLDDMAASEQFSLFRFTLPSPGEGTMRERLDGIRVRAKTGTLDGYSALSGYVFLERRGEWASFSILSQGTSKMAAMRMEDRIVRLLAEKAR